MSSLIFMFSSQTDKIEADHDAFRQARKEEKRAREEERNKKVRKEAIAAAKADSSAKMKRPPLKPSLHEMSIMVTDEECSEPETPKSSRKSKPFFCCCCSWSTE